MTQTLPHPQLVLDLLRPKWEGRKNIQIEQHRLLARITISSVCRITGIDAEQILLHTRQQNIVDAKFIAIGLLREKTLLTQKQIAALLCVKHPSVYNAINKCENYKATDKRFAFKYLLAEQMLLQLSYKRNGGTAA